jgi:hypothetical protein
MAGRTLAGFPRPREAQVLVIEEEYKSFVLAERRKPSTDLFSTVAASGNWD